MIRLLLCALLVVTLTEVPAQDHYPSRPIRIIVPTAPGGPSDMSLPLF